MSMNYELSMEQKQLLSQTQIQSLELLTLCNVELSSFLNNEYMENPLLDHAGGSDTPGSTEEFQNWYSQNQTFSEGYGHSDRREERSREAVPSDEGVSMESYLKEQLRFENYTSEEWNLIGFLIMNLDDNGFYSTSVEETAKISGAPVSMVEKCLSDLRQLEPFGIFAEDLESCLIRQLEVMGVEEGPLTTIIREHLEDASRGKISNITRHLGIPSGEVRKYIAFIATLNPKPLSGFSAESTSYIVPDILFEKKQDEWEISLNDEWMGNYQLNEYYMKMITQSTDEQLQEYFRNKLERARFVLNSIEQRRKTILSVSREILNWQRDYFEGKSMARPMTMTEIAEKLDIHPSTVSRAMKGKYIQYPGGTVLAKDLFSSAVSGDEKDSAMTADQIKDRIRQMIQEEDTKKPYSDQAIANKLKEQGIVLSRRGVAKYREELGIRGSFERKETL